MGREPPTKASRRQQNRLPVNQRRHKVAPENRKRVSTACNSCNVRRIKCTGERPCQPCRNSSRECQYPEASEKISVPRPEWEELVAKCAKLERCLEQAVPDATQRRQLLGSPFSVSTGSSPWESESARPSYRSDVVSPSDEPASSERGGSLSSPRAEHRVPSEEDSTARYLGPTSGSAFLGHVKEFMANLFTLGWSSSDCPSDTITLLDSVGRFQTRDPRPLRSRHEERPVDLPRKDELNGMVKELSQFLQDTHNDSYYGNLPWWDNKLDLDSLHALPGDAHECRQLAFLHATLAVVCVLGTSLPAQNNMTRGDAFFERARYLMGNPLDAAGWSLLNLPHLAMMAVYLIEVDRTDAAYIYVSLGMHIGVIHGAHQGRVQDEREKRSFWTLYHLDRWLCLMLGRPPTLLDESIDLAPPVDAHGLPKSLGLVAHVKLAKIAGHIIRKSSSGDHDDILTDSSYVDTTLKMLQKWSATLPAELRLSSHHSGIDRAACELRMKHNQLVIITTRATLLDVLRRALAARTEHRTWHWHTSPQYSHVWQCLDAARENLRLARWILETSSSPRTSLAPVFHNLFDAAVIVLLHELLAGPSDTNQSDNITFALDCFDAQAKNSDRVLSNDYARVLRDLKTLVQRMLHPGLGSVNPGRVAAAAPTAAVRGHPFSKRNTSISQDPSPAIYDVGFILNPEIPPETPAPAPAHPSVNPSSHALFTELSSWISNDEHHVYDNYPTY
ncbi:hypothetical protein PG996_011972 [Apiospora saccharicola]|uniref:Zn(2)-C6 fungal-type domain-containing protein n=1 Tax=Apiospora saccharicola TaxID=335842 RepID=A0ABR1U3E9_9PEZI